MQDITQPDNNCSIFLFPNCDLPILPGLSLFLSLDIIVIHCYLSSQYSEQVVTVESGQRTKRTVEKTKGCTNHKWLVDTTMFGKT